MARRSKSKSQRDGSRDPLDDLDQQTPVSGQTPSPAPLARVIRQKSVLEDRRNWAPRLKAEPQRVQARDTLGRPARIVHGRVSPRVVRGPGGKPLQSKKHPVSFLSNARALFAEPRKAIICAKRKIRREVLHALHRTGKGSRSPKRRNEWSNVQC